MTATAGVSAKRGARQTPRAPVAARRPTCKPPAALVQQAARNTLAANPLIGFGRKDVSVAATALLGHLARRPGLVTKRYAGFMGELARVAAGRSKLGAQPGDRRFADRAWNDSAVFRRLLQAHVALGDSLNRCVDEAGLDARNADRARFAVSLFVDALAPTNFLAGNPAALRKLVDTKGVSVIRGFANFVEDLASGRGLPRQVDARPFTVGKNVATTPGAVVFRNELLELIQYAPSTPVVHARPLLIVPPQINKFYVFDLGPSNSLVRWSLAGGVQTFVVSWRNPTREHAECGLDAYVAALEQAVDVMRKVSGTTDVNVFGACSGGITLTALLAWLAAVGRRKVKSATLAVCVLDTAAARDTTASLFVTPATIAAARASSRKRGVLEGRELARMFAWMRPNDLVWNYVVNNYLLGNDPPAHDILFWNSDTTRLPARLHADFLALYETNPFPRAGALRVRRRKVDAAKIGMDTYVVGGLTDHITPWQAVYRTAQLFGGARSTFVLSNGGHVQSLVNPTGNPRSWFMAGHARTASPESWFRRQQTTEGSWWPHWRAWIKARSGPTKSAPASLGSARHPAIVAAPGAYVLER
jgi:polyhydroxyalkanoate synthase